jgi:hypothetical protein
VQFSAPHVDISFEKLHRLCDLKIDQEDDDEAAVEMQRRLASGTLLFN